MFLPRLYAIVDASLLAQRNIRLREFAFQLHGAGVKLVQWRNKTGSPQEVLAGAVVLREVFAGAGCRLLMNDRADLTVLAGLDGVHVGQGDLSPQEAKAVMRDAIPTPSRDPEEESTRALCRRIVGVSTHTEQQVRAADAGCADYIAVGPVFSTGTKLDAEAVIGLDGVRRARALTAKPLVAIGGVTRQNARRVIQAGADAVAVISGLLAPGETVEKVARDFLEVLG